jgi:SAM-dependent methyltransferase
MNVFDLVIRPLRILVNKILKEKHIDDFRWSTYTQFDYAPQLNLLSRKGYEFLLTDQMISELRSGNELTLDALHSPHLALYKLCLGVEPTNVLEVGAGAGYHMINLSKLLSSTEVHGVDLLPSQVELGQKMFPNHQKLLSKIQIMDFANSQQVEDIPTKFDVVYTQAVTMHLSIEKAARMVNNMIRVSNKYVFLVEEFYSSHDYEVFARDISSQHPGLIYSLIPVENSTSGIVKFTLPALG